jgi:hypothetical protein
MVEEIVHGICVKDLRENNCIDIYFHFHSHVRDPSCPFGAIALHRMSKCAL